MLRCCCLVESWILYLIGSKAKKVLIYPQKQSQFKYKDAHSFYYTCLWILGYTQSENKLTFLAENLPWPFSIPALYFSIIRWLCAPRTIIICYIYRWPVHVNSWWWFSKVKSWRGVTAHCKTVALLNFHCLHRFKTLYKILQY